MARHARSPSPATRLPGAIRIGRRHRQDLGDLAGLAASILDQGLLHPIVVRPDGTLVVGRRRLAAWQMAHGAEVPIPVHVLDVEAVAAGEYDENVFRKDLTPSELVTLMRAVMPAIAADSRTRQAELGRRHGTPPLESRDSKGVDPRPWERGRSRDKVARLLGVSAATLSRAAQVVDAAAAEPERFGRLAEAMDRTGRVNGPWKRLVVMRQAERIRAEPPPMPARGPYRVMSADVPWPYDPDSEDQSERATAPYPRMTYGQIEAFGAEVLAIAHPDSVLWFWATNHHLPAAYSRILPAWGYEPRTVLTWDKGQIGRGDYLREQTEHCILAIRGRPAIELSAESTLLRAPRGAHSEKPGAFYDLVERVCPAPRYACLFSHGQPARPSWDQHATAPLETAGHALEEVAGMCGV